ncbi:MAG: hypothetical protein P8Y53_20770, partial [Pseudolabrys sp.]
MPQIQAIWRLTVDRARLMLLMDFGRGPNPESKQGPAMNPISPANTSEPWRVGVLFSRSGFMAIIEETQV